MSNLHKTQNDRQSGGAKRNRVRLNPYPSGGNFADLPHRLQTPTRTITISENKYKAKTINTQLSRFCVKVAQANT